MRKNALPYMSSVIVLFLYDIIMQIKKVIESVLKVSSLIIVLNGFEIVTGKFMSHFEGEKGEIPYTSGKKCIVYI
jgi:hypothetical protein